VAYRTWPRPLHLTPSTPVPAIVFRGDTLRVEPASKYLLGRVAALRDELSAYLYFEHLRSQTRVNESQVLLTAREVGDGALYRIYLVLDRDLLQSVPYLADLQARRFISSFALDFVGERELGYRRQQTQVFVAAYNLPVRRKLETLSPGQLLSPMARFILFKSKTDRRVREQIQPVPPELSGADAREMAADIIAVAAFYSLPLDFFLGIGAMENNYMNIEGDLDHAIWKRRPEKGDIVLKRQRGRVLVKNFSLGVWQITRNTLRYAHTLYRNDQRDYSELPERLRPPEKLDLDAVDPLVLTTYAGLLFRDLIDRFDGDVEKAVGAYNGGWGNPNLRYAAGVENVAEHARRVLEQAAALNGEVVANTTFITTARPQPAPNPDTGPVGQPKSAGL
jgi:hypothetical protein